MDTFVSDLRKTPTSNNFGNFTYDNMSEFETGDHPFFPGTYYPTFINYVEGIYVGYRYYETAAEEGFINYEDTVIYPFGHGLSYTTFSQEIKDVETDGTQIRFNVKVTNTGDVPGKGVVEVYFRNQWPFITRWMRFCTKFRVTDNFHENKGAVKKQP